MEHATTFEAFAEHVQKAPHKTINWMTAFNADPPKADPLLCLLMVL
jgi:hypothetical protein